MTFDIYHAPDAADALTATEAQLAELIENYRVQNGLPIVPLSASLSLVAARHVEDTIYNLGGYQAGIPGENNAHGWSDDPYNALDPSTYPSIWTAPQRLGTSYPGTGYEILTGYLAPYTATTTMTPALALSDWENSPPHNAVILNQSPWDASYLTWGALGVGMLDGVASVWFGHETDPAGSPDVWLQAGYGSYTVTVTPQSVTVLDTGGGSDPSFTIPNARDLIFTDGIYDVATGVFTPNAGLSIAISGTSANQATSDIATISPFANTTITDLGAGQTETVTITLSAAANGVLSTANGASYDATAGVYTDTGTAAAVTTALRSLVFAPTAHQVATGQTVTTAFTIRDSDTAGSTASDSTTTVVATAVAVQPPAMVNNTNGTSYLYTYHPSSTVAETIATYSGPGNSGAMISDVVDNADGTSLLYAYDPSAGVTLTASEYSGTDTTNGAPAGTQISDVVDDTDGTCLVYAYNPTSGVKQTTQQWSATNGVNGAPAGNEISNVVDNNDGTSLLYSYNPTSTVKQTASEYSATNGANGAPAGNEISDVVNNVDGTSILYAYNPTSTVSQTATYYTSTNTSSGAPAGTVTSETFDYTNGQSAITTYSNGAGNTVDYSGPNGTGSVIPTLSGAARVTSSAGISGQPVSPPDTTVIMITGSNQFIDPGSGNHTIQFVPGATSDTLLLHSGASDQILGFDPSAGDTMDLSALVSAANAHIGADISQLGDYVSIANDNGSASILFGGMPVASLVDGGGFVAQLRTLRAFDV